MQCAAGLVVGMLCFFNGTSPSSTVCRSMVDLILLYGRALYRVVTTWHHQVLDLREQGTESGKAASCSMQGYLDSLLAEGNMRDLVSW
jgi:hypothetical protein